MATIHQGKNLLKEKLDNFYAEKLELARIDFNKMMQERMEAHKNKLTAYRRALPLRILFLLVCLALFALFVLHPDIAQTTQDTVYNFFVGLEDSLGNAISREMLKDNEGIVKFVLDLLLLLLSFIAAVLLWLFRVSSGILVLPLCYVLPLVGAFFCVKGFIPPKDPFLDEEFNEERAKEQLLYESRSSEMLIIQSGVEGEEQALKLLSSLSNDCHIYTNLLVPYAGKVSETDIIVVAPHAVTIVEVKNYKDKLMGDWSDEHLLLEAERGNTTHQHEVYNPVKQVATHAYRLENYLKEHGVSAKVQRCVLFAHNDVNLVFMYDSNNARKNCPVFISFQMTSLYEYLQTPRDGTVGSRVIPLLDDLLAQQA